MDWMLNELAFAGPEHLDETYVPGYDHKAGTDPTEDVEFLRAQGLNASHTLIDFGAGTGAFALAIAPYCQRVIAVDVSPAMLQVLSAQIARQGISNVEVVQAGFLSYVHMGNPADFIYSRHALHHLPDFFKVVALKRVAAILRPDGTLFLRDLIISCEPEEIDSVIEGWLSKASVTPDVGWTRGELVTHLQDEYSTFSWLLEPMLEHAGFTIRQVQHDPSRVRSSYLCVRNE
ncbi:MAG: class I SAM-dependent methyltransferase [Armatimonas sp.]